MIDLVVAAGTARFGAFPVTARVAGINKVAVCACRHIVRRIDFRTGFANALVADAFLVVGTLTVGSAVSRNRRTSIARSVGTADARRVGRISRTARRSIAAVNRGTRFQRTAVAAAVGARCLVSRVFVAGTACSVSHLGTRFFRAAVACAVAAGFTRRVGVVVAAARRRVPHFSAALFLAGIACAVGSRLVRGNGVVVPAARR